MYKYAQVLFTAVFSLIGPASAHALVVYDQLSTAFSGGANGGDEYYWQQEVRVGKSGQLVGLDVALSDLARQYEYNEESGSWEPGPNEEAEGAGWATFSIFQGAGWHTPFADDPYYVAPLFSTTVHAGDVCESWFSSTGCQTEWVNIDLSAQGLFFDEGDFFHISITGRPGLEGTGDGTRQ